MIPVDYHTPQPTPNEVQEKTRWLPAGVKKILRELPAADTPLQGNPENILKYLDRLKLTHTAASGKRKGDLILNRDGQRVRATLIRRLKGES